MTNYIVSINYKKSFQKQFDNNSWSKPVFLLVSKDTSRKQFIEAVREINDDLDLRTVKFVDEIPLAPQGVQYLEGLSEEI